MAVKVSYDWSNVFASLDANTSISANPSSFLYEDAPYLKQYPANTREELEQIESLIPEPTFGDKIIDSASEAAMEYIFKPIGYALRDGGEGLIALLNTHSVEIITASTLVSGLGMMLGTLAGGNPGVWLGRVVFVLSAGSLWRLLI